MNGFADVIVFFLFLPMTVFIIVPLTMLSGWLVLKAAGLKKIEQTAESDAWLREKR